MRLLIILLVACTTAHPTPTGTTCPDPDPVTGTTTLTYDNFGHDFMAKYCNSCHSHCLPNSKRNGAPLFHDFDYLEGVLEVPDHIDEQTGWGPKAQNNFMPGGGTGGQCPSVAGGPLNENCPEPTDEERTKLSQWIACERLRQHDFSTDAGIPTCP